MDGTKKYLEIELTQNKKASIFIPIECREREEIKAVLEGE